MLHLLKYQFLQTIRSRSIMFWALAFPLILGTLFYVSFGNTGLAGTGETDWEPLPSSQWKAVPQMQHLS